MEASLDLTLDGPFQGGTRDGARGMQRGPLSPLSVIARYTVSTVIPCLKKMAKTHKSRDTPLELSWLQHFFTGNHIDCILIYNSNYFNFVWLYKGCSNKHGYNFDHVSKIGYSGPFQNTGILKWRLWHHNSYPWRHQQNIITWLKLHCRCGHATKVW